jgi:hypothetical protein
MTVLAEEISASLHVPIVTDRPSYSELARSIVWQEDAENLQRVQVDAQTIIERLVVDFIDPSCLSGFSMREILEFRRRRADEMRLFRKEIEGAIETLTTCTDENHFVDLLRDTVADLNRAVREHRSALELEGFAVAPRALGASGLGALAIGSGLLHVTTSPVLSAVGFIATVGAIGVEAALRYRRVRGSSGYQYLLSQEWRVLDPFSALLASRLWSRIQASVSRSSSSSCSGV